MNRVYLAILQWLAYVMEFLANFLQTRADYLRYKISVSFPDDRSYCELGTTMPNSESPNPDHLHNVETPPLRFGTLSKVGNRRSRYDQSLSPTLAASQSVAPGHWVADLRRIQSRSERVEQVGELPDLPAPTPQSSPPQEMLLDVNNRASFGTGIEDFKVGNEVSQLRAKPEEGKRCELKHSQVVNVQPKSIRITLAKSQELDEPRIPQERPPMAPIRLSRASLHHVVSADGAVSEIVAQRKANETAQKASLVPSSRNDIPNSPAEPLAVNASLRPITPPQEINLNAFGNVEQDVIMERYPDPACASFRNPKVAPKTQHTSRSPSLVSLPLPNDGSQSAIPQIQPAEDHSPWPELPQPLGNNYTPLLDKVQIHRQHRLAERINRLEREQRGEL